MSLREEIATLMSWGLANRYPHVSSGDHKLIINTTLDNYFSREGLMEWYKQNADFLDETALKEIRAAPHTFFYRETHDVGGYIPLNRRKEFNDYSKAFVEITGLPLDEARELLAVSQDWTED